MCPQGRAGSSRYLVVLAFLAGCALPTPDPADRNSRPETGLTTLYYLDPLSHSMSFGSGREGGVIHDFAVGNQGRDIDFGHYAANAFTVAIEGGRTGGIVDLGSVDSLEQQYGYSETVGRGQGFASIRLQEGQFVILKDASSETTQPLQGTDGLLGKLETSGVSAPVHTDHVYLMRLTDIHDPSFERIVKFQVVAYTPGESATIRWYRLRG